MPFIPNTPESLSTLLSRTNSNTCSGVTNAGKPCTRTLKTSPGTTTPTSGIITTIANSRIFFCESHKDQSTNVALRHTASFARQREQIGRGSMDTFIEQVEVLVGAPGGGGTTRTKITAKTKKVKPQDDPFAPAPEEAMPAPRPPSPPGSHAKPPPRPNRREPSLLRRLLCCCFGSGGGEEEDLEYGHGAGYKATEAELRAAAARVVEGNNGANGNHNRKVRPQKDVKVGFETTPPTPPLPKMYPDRKQAPSATAKNSAPVATADGGPKGRTPASDYDYTPVFDPKSTTNPFFSYIPPTLTPKTQTRLQQELSKPFSDNDEPGYIYIFWLTNSPLSPSTTPGAPGTTAAAAALSRIASAPGQKPRVLLKIGRANNVQRRLHEWSAQCGYNLSLVRFYPHTSATSTPKGTPKSAVKTPELNAQVGKKVPNSHRIEHLIHLELRDYLENPEIQCSACGKTHKEWFSVEASREGLMGIDRVVKKWMDYGERSGMVTGPNAVPAPTVPKKSSNGGSPAAKTPARPDLGGTPVGQAQGQKKGRGLTPPASTGSGGRGKSPGAAGKGKSPGAGGRGKSPGGGRGKSPGRATGSGGKATGSGGKAGRKKKVSEDESEDEEYVPDDSE